MIIVEGVDNSGKTTLIYKLQSRFGLYSVKVPWKPKTSDEVKRNTQLVLEWDHQSGGKLITDRMQIISELIYGPVIRNTHLVTDEMMDKFLSEAEQHVTDPVVIVWCNPRNTIIEGSIEDREQMDGVKDNLEKLIISYNILMTKMAQRIPILRWDYTTTNYDQFCEQLKIVGRLYV